MTQKKIIKTKNAYTIVNPKQIVMQVIKRWTFDNPEAVIQSFDFTCCAAAVFNSQDGDKILWQSVCHPDYYADLAAKRLVYTSPRRNEDAGGSMLRVLKYYQKGFRIPLDSLGKVIARLTQSVDFNKIVKATPIGERENQVAKVVTGLLREVDPNIDPFHNAHLPTIIEGFQTEPTQDENILPVKPLESPGDK